jgi:hypothetical protein
MKSLTNLLWQLVALASAVVLLMSITGFGADLLPKDPTTRTAVTAVALVIYMLWAVLEQRLGIADGPSSINWLFVTILGAFAISTASGFRLAGWNPISGATIGTAAAWVAVMWKRRRFVAAVKLITSEGSDLMVFMERLEWRLPTWTQLREAGWEPQNQAQGLRVRRGFPPDLEVTIRPGKLTRTNFGRGDLILIDAHWFGCAASLIGYRPDAKVTAGSIALNEGHLSLYKRNAPPRD